MNGNIELVISIGFTLFTGSLMMVVYRLCHDALTYNRRFNITLLMLSFVSTILLTLIQNNPMLSLGVLGSLSICRIRTNTKDPRDLGFVFGVNHYLKLYFGANGLEIDKVVIRFKESGKLPF